MASSKLLEAVNQLTNKSASAQVKETALVSCCKAISRIPRDGKDIIVQKNDDEAINCIVNDHDFFSLMYNLLVATTNKTTSSTLGKQQAKINHQQVVRGELVCAVLLMVVHKSKYRSTELAKSAVMGQLLRLLKQTNDRKLQTAAFMIVSHVATESERKVSLGIVQRILDMSWSEAMFPFAYGILNQYKNILIECMELRKQAIYRLQKERSKLPLNNEWLQLSGNLFYLLCDGVAPCPELKRASSE